MIDNLEELYELILQDDEDGVFANSLVESPAIERDFVWLNKEVAFQSVSDEKQLVAGPILVPNKKILRIDGEGKRYSVFFTPETIELVARKFMKNKYGDEVTLEHGNKTSGVYLTESWIIEQSAKDKSNIYGFTLPRGTWFGVYKVDDKNIWDKVKDGTFRGFSIEGLFEHKRSNVKLSLEKQINDLTEDEAKELLNTIHQMLMPTINLEGTQPSIPNSSYAGEISKKKKDDK
jgi:GTPase SAR1 family protein